MERMKNAVSLTSERTVIVAIEGLDGSGKSTTVKLLADALGAEIIRNPPTSLAPDRAYADSLPPDERRAWYLNANRVAMDDARRLAAKGRAVVLDRSIASTLAFGAAERGRVASPADVPPSFPLPDAVVLLELPETERRRRHLGRHDTKTAEEGRLVSDDAFRERVLAGYRKLCSHTVSAAGSPDQVVTGILNALERPGRM